MPKKAFRIKEKLYKKPKKWELREGKAVFS
jgi:hypothetical protein